jgi:hypothetical protein
VPHEPHVVREASSHRGAARLLLDQVELWQSLGLVSADRADAILEGRYHLVPPAGVAYLQGMMTGQGRAEYGIESYFVQEAKGQAYEEAARSGRLTAEIAVAVDGRAALRQLHANAK